VKGFGPSLSDADGDVFSPCKHTEAVGDQFILALLKEREDLHQKVSLFLWHFVMAC